MKSVSGKEFAKALERHGWQLLRVHGSHHIYGRKGSVVRLSIPAHRNHPPRQRYALIDHRCLMDLLGIHSIDLLQRSPRSWVETSLRVERSAGDRKWSTSIAVGNKGFVTMVKKQPNRGLSSAIGLGKEV